jgi:hypothetical protein
MQKAWSAGTIPIAIALIEWRDAREAIFNTEKATTEMWARLSNAEHRLMTLAREMKD